MQKQIIECVPNFSEGRNMDVIKQKLETKQANMNARRDPNVVPNPYD